MNKVIAIYDGYYTPYDETTLHNTGLGGSESWVVYISESLAKISNNRILVYCNCDVWHIHNNMPNIEYIPHQMFSYRSGYQYYDAILISRAVDYNIINDINNSSCCNNLYLIAHDLEFRDNDNRHFTYNDIICNDFLLNNIKGIFVLSEWHKQYMIDTASFPEELLHITRYGINDDLLNVEENSNRDNSIFWSNAIYRNFDLFVNNIFPLIKESFSDSKIYFSSYGEIPEEYKYLLENENVINLGSLPKKELYAEMSKHKCSFYPLLFPETFCMTCIEQVLCGTQLVMPLRFGPNTTFKPYKHMFMNNKEFDNFGDISYAAHEIINAINTYNSKDKIDFRSSVKDYIIENYNWNNIAKEMYNIMIKRSIL